MTRFLYDRLRAEVAELRRRISAVAGSIGGGGSHAQPVGVRKNSAGTVFTRARLNFIEGSGATLTVADDGTEVDITVAATGATLADGDYGDVTVSGSGTVITIDSDAVTYAKLQNVSAADRLLGRGNGGGSGDVQEIALGTGLSMSGTTLNATGGVSDGDKGDVTVSSSGAVWTIDNDVVTNAKAANMAEATIKGRADGAGTGDPTDLTPNQVSTILDGATDPFVRTSAAGGGGSPVGPTLEATIGATFTGTDIAVGKQRIIRVPYGFGPMTWVVYSDATISIVIDIWADNLGAYPPADAESITGGNEPEVSGGLIDDGDASAFDALAAGDFVTFNIDSVTVGSATWVTIQLIGTRT